MGLLTQEVKNMMKENIENVEKDNDSDVRYFSLVPFCNYCTATWGPVGFVNTRTLRCIYWVGGDPPGLNYIFNLDYTQLKPEDKEYKTALKSDEKYTKKEVYNKIIHVMSTCQNGSLKLKDPEYIKYIEYVVDWLFK